MLPHLHLAYMQILDYNVTNLIVAYELAEFAAWEQVVQEILAVVQEVWVVVQVEQLGVVMEEAMMGKHLSYLFVLCVAKVFILIPTFIFT